MQESSVVCLCGKTVEFSTSMEGRRGGEKCLNKGHRKRALVPEKWQRTKSVSRYILSLVPFPRDRSGCARNRQGERLAESREVELDLPRGKSVSCTFVPLVSAFRVQYNGNKSTNLVR